MIQFIVNMVCPPQGWVYVEDTKRLTLREVLNELNR